MTAQNAGLSASRKKRGRPTKAEQHAKQLANLPPEGQRVARQILREEMFREVEIKKEDGTSEKMSVVRALYRSWGVSAIRGNQHAQRDMAHFIRLSELEEATERQGRINQALDYQSAMREQIARRRSRGDLNWTPIPHPDDIIVDIRSGEVTIGGPLSTEEARELEEILLLRDACKAQADDLAREYRLGHSDDQKDRLLSKWQLAQNLFDGLNAKAPKRVHVELEDRLISLPMTAAEEAMLLLREEVLGNADKD